MRDGNGHAREAGGMALAAGRAAHAVENDKVSSALQALNRRLAVVRDRVRGVALRHHTGFYLFGRPGTSKTFTVLTTLQKAEIPYFYHNGHVTPMGLFDLLAEQHDRVVVLDDVSAIFEQRVALQLLLAALGNRPDEAGARVIKYRRQGREETVRFTGGIICISNLELHSAPLLQALKSRMHYVRFAPSDDEMIALILDIAGRGWPARAPKLSPRECREVSEFLIGESLRLQCPLDIRLVVDKAFPDYLQYRDGNTEAHWKDLVITTLQEQLTELAHTPATPKSRAARKADEQDIVRDILAEYSTRNEQKAAWTERTGKSERAFERRLREIEGE